MRKKERTMVCVTRQKTCERLIKAGARVAMDAGMAFSVVHVVRPGELMLVLGEDGAALDYLFTVSKDVGADMTVLRSDDVPKALADFAKHNGVRIMVLGASGENGIVELLKTLKHLLPRVEIKIIN